MDINIPISKEAKTKAVLTLFNSLIGNLTDTEIKLTVKMIDMNITELDSDNRSNLRLSLNMGKYLFNNYIQSLKGKNILYNGKHNIPTLNQGLRQLVDNNSFNITFTE
jgi:hypothetical protein